jgi:hypothetical protein
VITTTHLRRTTAASAALVLALSLAACGGSDDGSGDDASDSPSPRASETTTAADDPTTEESEETTGAGGVPSEDELSAALLTTADLPEGFAVEPDDDSDDSGDTFEGTCLADVGKFSDALGFEPDSEAEVDLGAKDDASEVYANSQVEAYADPSALAPAFAEFTDTLQSCTTVETTDEDGVRYSLKIAYDDTVDLPGVDDQLRFEITGTISSGGQTYKLTYRFVVGLAGPFISVVGAYAIGDDTTGVLDGVNDLAVLQAGRVAELG